MNIDSFIFDMDGTLWDAVESYCAVWNRTAEEFGLKGVNVTREQLEPQMGRPLDDIFDAVIGPQTPRPPFMQALARNERTMMPSLGGVLYPGVRSTLQTLKDRGARLFMVSNCEASGLPNFLKYTGLTPLITDALSHGATGRDKTENIQYLIKHYNLEAPVYVGDTAGDCASTHAAGIPFIWAAYGFGQNIDDADATINCISDLIQVKI